MARFVVEDRSEDGLGWCVMGERGKHRKIISAGNTRELADEKRQWLTTRGYWPDRESKGVLAVPGGWEDAVEGLHRVQGRVRIPISEAKTVLEQGKKQRRKKVAKKKKEETTEVDEATAKKELREVEEANLGEQVVKIREEERLSWRLIAQRLDLGSPGKARALWSRTTGKPHKEAPEALRQGSPKREEEDLEPREPYFKEDTTREEVEEYLSGAGQIKAIYGGKVQTFRFQKFQGVKEGKNGLSASFVDQDGKSRTVAVDKITMLG